MLLVSPFLNLIQPVVPHSSPLLVDNFPLSTLKPNLKFGTLLIFAVHIVGVAGTSSLINMIQAFLFYNFDLTVSWLISMFCCLFLGLAAGM